MNPLCRSGVKTKLSERKIERARTWMMLSSEKMFSAYWGS
jgi:hypothetical protein